MTKQLKINYVERMTAQGDSERLEFTAGVNTIYGRKDSGKTKWLDMIDFWLGGTKSPADTFGSELAEKYSVLRGVITIGDTDALIERRWQERGAQGKIFVDDEPMTAKEFSGYILGRLDIPQLHYPKGNPYAERAWPELSWKTLYRHLYRTEDSWNKLASDQYDIDQYAVITLFLGIAEKLFSEELGRRVKKEKEKAVLEARKLQFQSLLDEITARLSSPDSPIQFATEDVIRGQILKLEEKIEALIRARDEIISTSVSQVAEESQRIAPFEIELSERRGLLISDLEQLEKERQVVSKRRGDIEALKNSVTDEINRLRRAKLAGGLLDEMRVTCCPVCDQKVSPDRGGVGTCYLCLQSFDEVDGNVRLDFEIYQLESEASELKELLNQLSIDQAQVLQKLTLAREHLSVVDRSLAPAKSKTAGLVDFRLGSVDAERGRLEEQVQVFRRLLSLLHQRDDLTKQIDQLTAEISGLSDGSDELTEELGLEHASTTLEDGMMTYLQALNEGDPNRWPNERINVRITEQKITFKINERNWSAELGATSKCYFLLAYQYGLLRLTGVPGFRYPGICIMDFPPSLQDGTTLKDKENFLIEPFVHLCERYEPAPPQVIVAGRSFQSLAGANIIELPDRVL